MISTKYSRILIDLFILFLPLFSLNNSTGKFKKIGFLAMLLFLMIASFILFLNIIKMQEIKKVNLKMSIMYIFLIMVFFIGTITNFSNKALTRLLQFILVFNFCFLYSDVKFNKYTFNIKAMRFVIIVYVCMLYVTSAQSIIKSGYVKSIYTNPNTLGMVSFVFYVLCKVINCIKRNDYYKILASIFVILIFLSNSRSCMISLLILWILPKYYRYISRTRFRWNVFIISVLFVIITFTCIYPNMDKMNGFESINSIMYNLTGKRIMSGRNYIWSSGIDLIMKKPLFGYGTGAELTHFIKTGFSLHNLYIQTALQNGIVGLMVLNFFIIAIWNSFYLRRRDKLVKLCSCFFITVLVLNTLEITLIQNNLSVGVMQWFIISIGISRKREIRRAHPIIRKICH